MKNLRDAVNARHLEALRFLRLIESDYCKEAYAIANPEQKKEMENAKTYEDLIRIIKSLGLEARPIMELRRLAKSYGIPFYYKKTKEQLIWEIRSVARKVNNPPSDNGTVCLEVGDSKRIV